MKKYIIFVILNFLFTAHVSAWEEIKIPDHVSKERKSPWNFIEDFEGQKEGILKFCLFSSQNNCVKNLSINDKGKGNEPFKIKKDLDGNKYLEITVKHGWNNDPFKAKGKETERAEFQTKQKGTLNKIVWIGFKMRVPKDFIHIDDRVLFFQYKNQHDPMKKSPLLGIRFYEKGNLLDLGGDTGGDPNKSWNQKESLKHSIRVKYSKKGNGWHIESEKNRDQNYSKKDFILTPNEKFNVTQSGNWSVFKIGVHNSKSKNGFVKVYKDNHLIFNYEGITYQWNGNYTGSYIRIGLYRDSGKRTGIKYPDQSIHFDDFTVVSDKKTLDELIKNKN